MDKIKDATACENMEEIRFAIDSLDHQIVKLIAKRTQYVENAAKFKVDKTAVRDEKRVGEVIASKKELARENGVSAELIGNIYKVMIDHFVSEELKVWDNSKKNC